MPKKKVYEALTLLSSLSKNKMIHPGETIELDPDDAQVLLNQHAIKEVKDGADDSIAKLGQLQDRTE